MSFVPRPQEIYKHFKGDLYQIVAIATHSETGEELVIYQALYGDFKTYARPLELFTSLVDRKKYPDVKQIFRFELQGADAGRQIRESGLLKERERVQEKNGSPQRNVPPVLKTPETQLPNIQEPEARILETRAPETKAPENEIDPLVMDFLDADTYAQKLNILAALHHRITDKMINTMAVACDVEIDEGDVETRYDSLRRCILMKERYECNRLR